MRTWGEVLRYNEFLNLPEAKVPSPFANAAGSYFLLACSSTKIYDAYILYVFALLTFMMLFSVIITVNSSVDTVTRLTDRGIKLRVLVGARDFISSPLHIHRFWGPIHSPIEWTQGGYFIRDKLTEHGADHSPLSSSKIKSVWSYTSALYFFMVWRLITHGDKYIIYSRTL